MHLTVNAMCMYIQYVLHEAECNETNYNSFIPYSPHLTVPNPLTERRR